MKNRFFYKSKSYFFRIKKIFLLTLLLPILGMVFIYAQANSRVKTEILESNERVLEQFFSKLEVLLGEQISVGYGVCSEEIVQRYAAYSKSGDRRFIYEARQIIDMLNSRQTKQNEDVFIYYPSNQNIISSCHGALEANDFASIYYSGLETDFFDMLNKGLEYTKFDVIQDGSKKNVFCIMTKQKNVGDQKKDFLVVQIISDEWVQNNLLSLSEKGNGSILLFNKDKELLFSGDGFYNYHINNYHDEYLYQEYVDGKKYYMNVYNSDVTNGYYAFATPLKVFWDSLYTLRCVCIGSIFLNILIAFYSIHIATRKTYEPMGYIIGRLEEYKKRRYDSDYYSETEFVTKILEEIKWNEQKQIQKQQMEKRNRAIENLLSLDEPEKAKEDLKEAGVSLENHLFQAVYIQVENGHEKDKTYQDFCISNVFEELALGLGSGYVVKTGNNEYAFVLNIPVLEVPDRLHEMLEQGIRFFEENFQWKLNIAIGDIYEDIEAVQLSYEEAKEAIRYNFILGKGKCIKYTDIKNREFHYVTDIESKLSRMIGEYLREKKHTKDSGEFVDYVLELYGVTNESSIETSMCFKYEVISVLYKTLMTSCNEFMKHKTELIDELVKQNTLKEFRDKFSEIIEFIWSKLNEEEQFDICVAAKNYIDVNYQNPLLSVKMLGEELHITSSYLSRRFTSKYGISIVDYIAKIRIKAAKEDLKNTSKSIWVIAEKNGFLSSTVFINTFKKSEGITPGKYREHAYENARSGN